MAIVSQEVVLTVQRLVTKYGNEQEASTWHLILNIVAAALHYSQVRQWALLVGRLVERDLAVTMEIPYFAALKFPKLFKLYMLSFIGTGCYRHYDH
jgi:hypothetical protein